MWSAQPEAATRYLEYVTREFEQYSAESVPDALRDPRASASRVLAALRFVQTRRLTGYESALREIFTSQRKGKTARMVDRACLDALVESTQNETSTAHFLADIATRNKPLRTSPLCAEGLKRLGPVANAVLLERLSLESRKVQRRKLALLLVKVSRTGMPEPLAFWSDATQEERTEALARWRAALEAKGRLP